MAVQEKSRKTDVHRPSASVAPALPASPDESRSEHGSDGGMIAYLESELKRVVCSPEIRQRLAEKEPPQDYSEDAELLLACLAIKFGIEEHAWVSRALESRIASRSTRHRQSIIETLLDQGVRETLPVARAILDEIIKWDADITERDADSSDIALLEIQKLSGYLERLFQKVPSQRADVLDQVAAENPPLKTAVDAILERDDPEANAKRRRWFSEGFDRDVQVGQRDKVVDELLKIGKDDEIGETFESPGQGGPAPLTKEEYAQLARQLEGRSHAFRQQLAAELALALNERIRMPDMPHETLEQKKELARWVNDQLEPLGLAVKCPNTELPAKLRGVTGSNQWPDVGRFCCEIYKDGKQKKTAYWESLPKLTLTDASPPEESQGLWQQTVGPKVSRKGRSRT